MGNEQSNEKKPKQFDKPVFSKPILVAYPLFPCPNNHQEREGRGGGQPDPGHPETAGVPREGDHADDEAAAGG